jgi:hypothetical protein
MRSARCDSARPTKYRPSGTSWVPPRRLLVAAMIFFPLGSCDRPADRSAEAASPALETRYSFRWETSREGAGLMRQDAITGNVCVFLLAPPRVEAGQSQKGESLVFHKVRCLDEDWPDYVDHSASQLGDSRELPRRDVFRSGGDGLALDDLLRTRAWGRTTSSERREWLVELWDFLDADFQEELRERGIHPSVVHELPALPLGTLGGTTTSMPPLPGDMTP